MQYAYATYNKGYILTSKFHFSYVGKKHILLITTSSESISVYRESIG